MYEGDAPLAERRAQALSLDRELLAELLGADELRELIDADALVALELELQRLTDDRKVRDIDGVHDLLRDVGDLRGDEVAARTAAAGDTVMGWLEQLEQDRRIYSVRVAGETRWAAAEDAARFRDALGVPPAPGLPDAFLEPAERPLIDLVARYARTHGPFQTADAAGRLGLPPDAVALALSSLEQDGRIVTGEFRPGGSQREWCDAEVLRRLRRRSLATLRKEVEPVEPEALGRFLPAWHGVGAQPRGVDRVLDVVEQLQGAPIPASILEQSVLASRLGGPDPAGLDTLLASGDVVWIGRGPLGSGDGRVSLYLREQAPLLAPAPTEAARDEPWWSERHNAVLEHLQSRGASFWPALYAAAGGGDPATALEVLWDLVWAGLVTNDSLAPLRALTGGTPSRRGQRRRPGRVVSQTTPPRAAGRWSLVEELLQPPQAVTARAAAAAAQLLDRHGIVTRDAVATDDIPGGFSAVYSVLKAMEESGRCRRGYFVEGLGGAQFALPGAIERLRQVREADDEPVVTVLPATDPANPYGGALPWPELPAVRSRPRRVAGAHVVVVDGHLVLFTERGGASVLAFTDDGERLALATTALAEMIRQGRDGAYTVRKINGDELEAARGTEMVEQLRAAGFTDTPRGLTLRPRR